MEERIEYEVPESMENIAHEELCKWGEKQFIEDYGKYAMYQKGVLDNMILIRDPRVHEVITYQNRVPLEKTTLYVHFTTTRFLEWEEAQELVADIGAEPADNLILVRAQHPELSKLIDRRLRGDKPKLDIGSRNQGAAGRLSNFTARSFVFDDVICESMEGLLQAFKFREWEDQKEIVKLVGFEANQRGQERNWKSSQVLWWRDTPYHRESKDYQLLLNYAFEALYTNKSFEEDLDSTGDAHLSHVIGKSNVRDTVLTEKEFCSRLEKLRRIKGLIDPVPGENGVNDFIDAILEKERSCRS